MIRDILNAVQQAMVQVHPPGTSGPTPGPTNVGTGVVSFHTDSIVQGAYSGRLMVLTNGVPGVATAKLSLDANQDLGVEGNYDAPFTMPVDRYDVPLPAISPGLGSPGLSGLVLSFSGSFNAGDTYFFVTLPQVTFLVGEEEIGGQDTLFPRVVTYPANDAFSDTQDYAQGRDQRTRQRTLTMDVAYFESHCWGIDYDRTEILRDLVINATWFALQAARTVLNGHWESAKKLGKSGHLYVLTWNVKKPVVVLTEDTRPLAPPFTHTINFGFTP